MVSACEVEAMRSQVAKADEAHRAALARRTNARQALGGKRNGPLVEAVKAAERKVRELEVVRRKEVEPLRVELAKVERLAQGLSQWDEKAARRELEKLGPSVERYERAAEAKEHDAADVDAECARLETEAVELERRAAHFDSVAASNLADADVRFSERRYRALEARVARNAGRRCLRAWRQLVAARRMGDRGAWRLVAELMLSWRRVAAASLLAAAAAERGQGRRAIRRWRAATDKSKAMRLLQERAVSKALELERRASKRRALHAWAKAARAQSDRRRVASWHRDKVKSAVDAFRAPSCDVKPVVGDKEDDQDVPELSGRLRSLRDGFAALSKLRARALARVDSRVAADRHLLRRSLALWLTRAGIERKRRRGLRRVWGRLVIRQFWTNATTRHSDRRETRAVRVLFRRRLKVRVFSAWALIVLRERRLRAVEISRVTVERDLETETRIGADLTTAAESVRRIVARHAAREGARRQAPRIEQLRKHCEALDQVRADAARLLEDEDPGKLSAALDDEEAAQHDYDAQLVELNRVEADFGEKKRMMAEAVRRQYDLNAQLQISLANQKSRSQDTVTKLAATGDPTLARDLLHALQAKRKFLVLEPKSGGASHDRPPRRRDAPADAPRQTRRSTPAPRPKQQNKVRRAVC